MRTPSACARKCSPDLCRAMFQDASGLRSSMFSTCSSRPRDVLMRLSTKRFATSIAPMLGTHAGRRLVWRVPEDVLLCSSLAHRRASRKIACPLSVLSSALFLSQNFSPLLKTLTRRSPGPLSTAHANGRRDSQSSKLSRIVSSLSVLRSMKKLSICASCGEEELVSGVHTLFGRSAQVLHELQVQEEKEGVREEVQEIEGESSEEKRSHEHDHVDGVNDSLLEPRCVCKMM